MSARLATLRWVVEVTPAEGATRWEPIAAFNLQQIAESYARECAGGQRFRLYIYRVTELPEPVEQTETVTLTLRPEDLKRA